ncbi:hypothetical protein MRX96_019663 [Rhipicephalus microplus]
MATVEKSRSDSLHLGSGRGGTPPPTTGKDNTCNALPSLPSQLFSSRMLQRVKPAPPPFGKKQRHRRCSLPACHMGADGCADDDDYDDVGARGKTPPGGQRSPGATVRPDAAGPGTKGRRRSSDSTAVR